MSGEESEVGIMVGGPAGAGIISLGISIGRAIKRHGWNVFVYDDYPSLIKGGHNMVHIRASKHAIYSQNKNVNILVAFDNLSIEKHIHEISPEGMIIHDASFEPSVKRDDISFIAIPFNKLLSEIGEIKYYNMIALGVVASILDMNKSIVEEVIEDTFKGKSQEIIEVNKKAFHLGFSQVRDVFYKVKIDMIKRDKERLFMDGNTAAVLGAIKAGVKYVGMYPMTPTSPILTLMSKYEKKKKIVVKQTEDEIAAINSVIGASFAGARSMAATSGGGFALMVEALGMAGLMELPIVIIEGQRGSPSTGMPTYTEQGDLRFVMHAAQGETPRVVIAPGDVEETFYAVFDAFNIAEKLQTPVIVLLDKYLCTSYQSIPRFDTSKLKIDRGKLLSYEEAEKVSEYKRYSLNEEDGISYRSLPSYPNTMHVVSSYEHDETGFTTENIEMRNKQMEKRMKKLNALDKEIYKLRVYEKGEPEINLICWGSTKMPCLEAQRMLYEEHNIGSRVLHYLYLMPFPTEDSIAYLNDSAKNLLIELNYTSQLGGLIREHTGIEIHDKYLKYDGRPFMPEDIVEKALEILRK